MMSTTSARYTKVAVVLHWLIAIAMLTMLPLGFWMHRAITHADTREIAYSAFQFHKSLGLSILALSIARLLWRLTHKAPPLAEAMPAWEKWAARATHWAFYFLIIALPLTGWMYVSAGWSEQYHRVLSVPTVWFGLFTVPHLPGFADLPEGARASTAHSAAEWHEWLAFFALALIALHVGAALKHNFIDRDETLEHMVARARSAILLPALIMGAVGLSFLFVLYALSLKSEPPPEAPASSVQSAAAAAQPQSIEQSAASAPQPSNGPSPPAWKVDKAASKITFTGEALSGPFTGSFDAWTADIKFSPDNLAASKAVIVIQTASAVVPDPTGTAMLKETDWFAVKTFPAATYTTTAIRSLGGDKYEADGHLTIKGKSARVILPFSLSIVGKVATMKGSANIERLAWDVGLGTAPKEQGAEAWASGTIAVSVNLRATQQ